MSARVAHSRLRRVSVQRASFATAYGRARTPIERLVAVVSGLRAALPAKATASATSAGSGPSTEPEPEASRRLDRAADDLADLLTAVHTAQETAAGAVIRRRARAQSRKDQSDADAADVAV